MLKMAKVGRLGLNTGLEEEKDQFEVILYGGVILHTMRM